MIATLLRVGLWLVVSVIVLLGTTMLIFMVLHSISWPSRKETLAGPDPVRRALIVYQPGLGSWTRDVARALAQGLNGAGYTVALDRPGKHLPTDLSPFAVIAFGSPVYAGQTSPALRRYMRSISGYGDQAVILFAVGGTTRGGESELGQLADLVPAERISRRVKFYQGAGDRARASELGRSLGAGD